MTPKYVKMYGFYRTGTNYCEELIRRNTTASVLINALGHKHSLPEDWGLYKASNPQLVGGQIPQLDVQEPASLRAAIKANTVNVAVVVKDPYGIVYSYIHYRRARVVRHKPLAKFVEHTCNALNAVYAAWTDPKQPWHDKMCVIPYEKLLAAREEILSNCCDTWGLSLRRPVHDVLMRINSGHRKSGKPHNRKFWQKRTYVDSLEDNVRRIIAETIDWPLFATLGGYEKEVQR